MSHNVLNIQVNSGDVTGAITGTISEEMGLGQMLVHSATKSGTGTGTYTAGDNYLFYTGADSYSDEGVSISGDTISLTGGIYVILCVPTFGSLASTLGDTEAKMQFQTVAGEALGNIATVNRNSLDATFAGGQTCAAYVESPADVVLKVIAASAGDFPKNGTDSTNSPMFIEVIRVK